jgi:octaprenyl-diphosphate synthase
VVDGADLRRGQKSVNTVWGNEASVLVGDFLFSKSFSLMVADGDVRILKAMSDATPAMAEGEVLELLKTCDLEVAEEEYLQVVVNKTAVLIAAACEIGALLGQASEPQVGALRDFGLDVGVAFQMMDDCLDYLGKQEEFGKAVGTDLGEGKITLPLIHAVRRCTETEREFVRAVVDKESLEPEDLRGVLALIRKYGGFEAAKAKAVARVEEAKSRLSVFAPAPERDALMTVADYVVARTK